MANEMTTPEPDIFSINDIIDGKYVVHKRLGKGGYGKSILMLYKLIKVDWPLSIYSGEIYSTSVLNEDKMYAVKVERVGKHGNLAEEIKILKSLKGYTCKFFL